MVLYGRAFDRLFNPFTHNWWSDSSPGCPDTSPPDGWCDVNRPIPVANQDIEPKAGAWWGYKSRGYFAKATSNPGIVPKISCSNVTLPLFPNSTTGGSTTGGPIIVGATDGGGPGGPGGPGGVDGGGFYAEGN